MQNIPISCGPVLVVDDDGGARMLLRNVLTQAGYAVDAVDSGTSALEWLERSRPQLVLLDVCMPGLSGYEVCRQLRERHGSVIPVMFVSGQRVDPVDRAAGLLLGGDDYVLKPFSPDELLARVFALIRRTAEPAHDVRLTARELDVLAMLAAGLRRQEIARALVISPKTVSSHLGRIYEKLGARDRVQAVIIAHRTRLLDPL